MIDTNTDKGQIFYTDLRITDESSFIETIVYDEISATLYVQIDDTIYEYDGVDVDTWSDFRDASSVGRFYHSFTSGRKSSDRLDAPSYVYEVREHTAQPVEIQDVTTNVLTIIPGGLKEDVSENEDDSIDFSAIFPTEEESDQYRRAQNRQIALASASSVCQSRRSTSADDVIGMALEFEDYLNGE